MVLPLILRAPLHCMLSKIVVVYLQFYFHKEFPLTYNGISFHQRENVLFCIAFILCVHELALLEHGVAK